MNNTVIDGNGTSRVFQITDGATVNISNLTVTNGSASGLMNEGSGGGIQNLDGDLTLRNVMVSNCTASGDMGSQGGGGLHNAGTMFVVDCTIMNCTAFGTSGSGGGILNSPDGKLYA